MALFYTINFVKTIYLQFSFSLFVKRTFTIRFSAFKKTSSPQEGCFFTSHLSDICLIHSRSLRHIWFPPIHYPELWLWSLCHLCQRETLILTVERGSAFSFTPALRKGWLYLDSYRHKKTDYGYNLSLMFNIYTTVKVNLSFEQPILRVCPLTTWPPSNNSDNLSSTWVWIVRRNGRAPISIS